MYYDLQSSSKASKGRDKIVLRLIELGWSGVAWNVPASGKLNSNMVHIPPMIAIENRNLRATLQNRRLSGICPPIKDEIINVNSSNNGNFEQYSRITYTVDDMTDAQSLTAANPILQQFDVVAVTPGNFKVFTYLCKTADIDIIVLDFTHKIPFNLDKKLLDEAVRRGIAFEISYTPLISNASIRKEMISSTRLMIQYLRGRNIILSSGGDNHTLLRGPMDVANIAEVLGIKKELAIRCIRDNAVDVLRHGSGRKLRFSCMEAVPVSVYNQNNLNAKKRKLDAGEFHGLESNINNDNGSDAAQEPTVGKVSKLSKDARNKVVEEDAGSEGGISSEDEYESMQQDQLSMLKFIQ